MVVKLSIGFTILQDANGMTRSAGEAIIQVAEGR